MVKKILWISRIGYKCSYSYVSILLLSSFIKKYPQYDFHVFCIGIVHYESQIPIIANNIGISANNVNILKTEYFNNINNEDIEWYNNYRLGIYDINTVINKVKPDLIICLEDDYCVKKIMAILDDRQIPFIPYIAADRANFNIQFDAKNIWTMTEFGKQQFGSCNESANIQVLSHIIDNKSYFPIADKIKLRNKWVGSTYNSSFIVGSFNANHVRKRWDILIESFCQFAAKHHDAVLMIKTNVDKKINGIGIIPSHNYDMSILIKDACTRYSINLDRIIIFDMDCTNFDLNELYNCCDIGLYTTSGEGFGLTPCEMALCQIPSIVPNFSSFPEIFGSDSNLLIPTHTYSEKIGRYYQHKPTYYDPDKTLTNLYECICKSYVSHETKNINVVKLMITEDIDTIILSANGKNEIQKDYQPNFLTVKIKLLQHFQTIEFLITYLQNNILPHRLQILISNDINYMEQQYRYLYELKTMINQLDKRINYFIDKEDISLLPTVKIPHVSDVIKKLDEFYYNRNLIKKEGIKSKNIISEKYNSDIIVDQFKKLIDWVG